MSATVALIHCATYEPGALAWAVRAAVSQVGGVERFVKPGQRVVLKPNLLAPASADECVTTHPQFVGAVAALVREAGAEPVVADSPAFGTVRQVAERSGLLAVCEQLDLPLVPLRKPVTCTVETVSGERRCRVAREAVEADVLLNLPKLKAHRQVGLSGAVKNLYGCVPGKRKILGHFRCGPVDSNFARMIVEYYHLLRPALSLVDGIVAMEGKGPRLGRPRPLGWVVAGADAVAVDTLLVHLLGAPAEHRMLLTAAARLGVGETDLAKIRLVGEEPAPFPLRDFSWPPLIGTQFGIPRVVKSWLRNLWITRLGLARARSSG